MSDLKETDSYNQKISKDNYQDALKVFFAEFGFELFFAVLAGTTAGLYLLLGFYVIIGIIPIGLMIYYLFKKK